MSLLYQAGQLGKWRIAIPISLSAVTGYLVRKGNFDEGFLFTFLGVFLLGCGAMAINQIQEKELDARMQRTKNRPLPLGLLTTREAVLISISFLLTGSFFLLQFTDYLPLLFGWLTVGWYTLIYTPLKRITAFAAIPGSIAGAIPPVLGWLAAGGQLGDYRIWLIAFFFFIGQIPHFWLLLLLSGDEYEKAGLPALTKVFSEKQIERLTFIWIFWSTICSLFLAFFGVIRHKNIIFLLMAGAFITVLIFIPLLTSNRKKTNFKAGFIRLNIFYLYVMILLWIDSFL